MMEPGQLKHSQWFCCRLRTQSLATALVRPFLLFIKTIWNWWTGRAVREDKRGFIAAEMPPILSRLGLDGDAWVESVQHYGRRFHCFVGSVATLRALGERLGRRWLRGLWAGMALYGC